MSLMQTVTAEYPSPALRRSAFPWGRVALLTMVTILYAAAASSNSSAAGGNGAQQMVLATRAGGIRIDGVPSEHGWRDGPWYSGFTIAGLKGKLAPVQTKFAVRFDDAALYFAAVMDEPNMKGLRAQVTERDGFLYGRGVIDDLGMAAIELEVLLLLAETGVPLARDVILAWTGDE